MSGGSPVPGARGLLRLPDTDNVANSRARRYCSSSMVEHRLDSDVSQLDHPAKLRRRFLLMAGSPTVARRVLTSAYALLTLLWAGAVASAAPSLTAKLDRQVVPVGESVTLS